jgi:E3 ubiquitin-protein ligase SHPRH
VQAQPAQYPRWSAGCLVNIPGRLAVHLSSKLSKTVRYLRKSYLLQQCILTLHLPSVGGLLKFLRIQDVGYDAGLFQRLLKPSLGEVFTSLVSNIGVRTVKSQIQNELALPPQERYIVPVTFTPVEIFNYRTKYGEALTELQIAMNEARLTSSWTMDRRLMSRWLNILRQACFHAQAGVNDRQRARGGRKVGEEEAVVQ